jgi:hypothetical protein
MRRAKQQQFHQREMGEGRFTIESYERHEL